MRMPLSVVHILLVCWTPVAAADLTGLWSLDLMPDFGGNNDSLGCSFLQDGERVTLDYGAGPSITGEVQGQEITLRIPTGKNGELVARFVGEIDGPETTISGT
jgi:hypothetical protein